MHSLLASAVTRARANGIDIRIGTKRIGASQNREQSTVVIMLLANRPATAIPHPFATAIPQQARPLYHSRGRCRDRYTTPPRPLYHGLRFSRDPYTTGAASFLSRSHSRLSGCGIAVAPLGTRSLAMCRIWVGVGTLSISTSSQPTAGVNA